MVTEWTIRSGVRTGRTYDEEAYPVAIPPLVTYSPLDEFDDRAVEASVNVFQHPVY
ncbi:hypothetical protein [Nonomuraea sp. B19D2]|uniref:hypothetical protein n=1 Tax=Nonomuraea sp. B19D2 TaxID=3159561 RepID=UPI0032DB5103